MQGQHEVTKRQQRTTSSIPAPRIHFNPLLGTVFLALRQGNSRELTERASVQPFLGRGSPDLRCAFGHLQRIAPHHIQYRMYWE